MNILDDNINTPVFSVSEVTKNLKKTLENNPDLTYIWVKGEISNLTLHSSGHIYFTLKDEKSVINVTFFKYANKNLQFKLKEGLSIFAFGSISVFEKRGSYNLNITHVKLEGIGDLQKQIDELKKKLLQEGIFDNKRKQKLPFLPKRIGVVTSPTGAAIQDIIKVALRRYKNIEIIIAPAKVQGDDASITIIKAIEELNKSHHKIDVIIAGRGGGSFEDLLAFNDETVVRAYSESKVPIISAVGHQIDHPLSDDAADAYAPTPSAAAEISIPLKQDLIDEINYHYQKIETALENKLKDYKIRLHNSMQKRVFLDPYEIINKKNLILSDFESKMKINIQELIHNNKNEFLQVPDIIKTMKTIVNNKKHAFKLLLQNIEKLSPMGTLSRGYAIATDSSSNIIHSIKDISKGDDISIRITDGAIECTVINTNKGDTNDN